MQDSKSESYEKIMEYEKKVHEKNQKRIQVGIRLVVIIPLIFLFVMFKLDSSKVVFLVLWIASLFGISIYLVGVEYMDYQLQIKLSEFGIREDKPVEGLLKEESKVEDFIVNAGLLDDNRPSRFKALTQKEEEPVAEVSAVEIQEDEKEQDAAEPVISQIMKEFPDAEEGTVLGDAEEELVQSIRKYVAALSAQSVQNGIVDKKSPQDYAAMRKARALEKHEKEQAEKE